MALVRKCVSNLDCAMEIEFGVRLPLALIQGQYNLRNYLCLPLEALSSTSLFFAPTWYGGELIAGSGLVVAMMFPAVIIVCSLRRVGPWQVVEVY